MIFANYNPQSCTKLLETFLSSRETFFCRSLKNYSMSFLGWCNVETGPLLLKSSEHIVQKYIAQMSPPENKKCSPGKPPSNLATFEQERP